MKINYEYLKKLLESFEASDKVYPEITDLVSEHEVNKQFVFHMNILQDKELIVYPSSDHGPFFNDDNEADGFSWVNTNVRLTAQGHEFLAVIRQKEVWSVIKKEFKESSVETVWKVAQDMVNKIANKKIEKLVDLNSI